MIEISKDPNAKLAFEQSCKKIYETDHGRLNTKWEDLNEHEKNSFRDKYRCDRLKHFMEQSEAKVHEQNGTFVCESGYAFKNIVDQCEHYRIYRCDGGHHYAVVFIEHKERGGSQGLERKLVIKNGQLIEEQISQCRNEDALEID